MKQRLKDLLTINLYSNCIPSAPNADLLSLSFKSAIKSLDIPNNVLVRIFIDPSPKVSVFDEYVENVRDVLRESDFDNFEIIETSGLADSYVKAIELADTPFCLQLAHDFLCLPENVHHDAKFFIELLEVEDIDYLRFNKRRNLRMAWDQRLEEVELRGIKCCKGAFRSDMLHFLQTKPYKEHIKVIDTKNSKGSGGVELILNEHLGLGYMYGGVGHEMILLHLDGKRKYHAVNNKQISLETHIENMKQHYENAQKDAIKRFGEDFVWCKSWKKK